MWTIVLDAGKKVAESPETKLLEQKATLKLLLKRGKKLEDRRGNISPELSDYYDLKSSMIRVESGTQVKYTEEVR